MKTRQIGEVFNFENVNLEVVAANGCLECYFVDKYCLNFDIHNIVGACSKLHRTDKKPV